MMKSPTISYKAVALDRLTPREQETINVIRELNAGYGRAFLNADTAWYDTTLADDFQCITSAGTRLNKQEFLQRAAQPVSMEDFRFEDVDIRLFGDVAIIHALNPYTSSHGHSGASR
jgi:ketosteroid isomerase-like protein